MRHTVGMDEFPLTMWQTGLDVGSLRVGNHPNVDVNPAGATHNATTSHSPFLVGIAVGVTISVAMLASWYQISDGPVGQALVATVDLIRRTAMTYALRALPLVDELLMRRIPALVILLYGILGEYYYAMQGTVSDMLREM